MAEGTPPLRAEDISRERADEAIKRMKGHRMNLDAVLQHMKADPYKSREMSLAITKLQECIMWLGMCCKELNDGVSCYPDGYNPESAKVDPTPDGVKL